MDAKKVTLKLLIIRFAPNDLLTGLPSSDDFLDDCI